MVLPASCRPGRTPIPDPWPGYCTSLRNRYRRGDPWSLRGRKFRWAGVTQFTAYTRIFGVNLTHVMPFKHFFVLAVTPTARNCVLPRRLHGSPAFCPRFVLATEAVDTPTSEGAWNSGHPGPRPSGARCARVHLRSCSDVAKLGQNIQPEAAKRTVQQTATLDTEGIFMTINNFHANEGVLVQYPG